MVDHEAVGTLSSVHRQLLDILADLDRTQEHAAAAHILAALDIVEARLESEGRPTVGESANGPGAKDRSVVLIADGMRGVFGVEAEAVARRQLSAASGPAMLAWAAIVNRLSR